MVFYTYSIFGITPDSNFLLFVFFATLTSYSFHWYLTPDVHSHSERYIWVNNNKTLLLSLFILSISGTIIFMYIFRMRLLLLSGVAVFTFLYSASKIPFRPFTYLKKIIVGKTFYLAVAWTIVTVIIPVIIAGKNWEPGNTMFMINRFFLIYPVCILFDYRDREEDKEQNIKNIVGLLSLKQIKILFYICLLLFFISGGILSIYEFSFPELLVLLVPGIFLSFSYGSSISSVSDYWYYFYLDGLMMLSGILSVILKSI